MNHPLQLVALAAQPGCEVDEAAQYYHLPVAKLDSTDYAFLLVKSLKGWQLQDCTDRFHPWQIDFMAPTLQQRVKKATPVTEMLAKAVGIKPKTSLRVLDATAGLGRDSFILASLGCQVTMVERSPVLAILLQDALTALTGSHLSLQLHWGDAFDYLQQPSLEPFDVIYLDPMFPEKTKAALVKKEMQILQALLGQDTDSDALLALARSKARNRVVVKRPKTATFLGNTPPNHEILSKKYRFDVYLSMP